MWPGSAFPVAFPLHDYMFASLRVYCGACGIIPGIHFQIHKEPLERFVWILWAD